MSEQDNGQVSTLQRPSTDNREDWKAYWEAQGQPWRTEPEIDNERQSYLEERRKVKPDPNQDIYPFKDVKLDRADIEWLLTTHENGRGPVIWSDSSQQYRSRLNLRMANLRGVNLSGLLLSRVEARGANLEEAFLLGTHLEGANLSNTNLQGAMLNLAHLEGALLLRAQWGGASLFNAFFDGATRLDSAILFDREFGEAYLADVHWSNVNVAVADWSELSILGDERIATESENRYRLPAGREVRSVDYLRTIRAYRQLSIVLRSQGLNEDAARFAYRAQLIQRRFFQFQKKHWQYLFSLLLDLLSGYGYKAIRSFIAYLIVIAAFATAYFIIGQTVGPELSPLGSVVFSMTSFHGRGFFPGGIKLDDPLTVLAALEAFAGLLIEVTFIATLTQRLFGK